MTLILRKCWKDGHSRNNFFYGQVGDRVTAPDWNPEPECGNGLHGLKEGNGDWRLLEGDDWLVIDADDQIVDIDLTKCKFNTGVILFRGSKEELSKTDFCHKMAINNCSAYHWARRIGNHDVMISRINDSNSAYMWAKTIGNKNVMIDRITDSEDAYWWAQNFGNRDVMINRITDPYWAFYWAFNIGNQDIMISKINNSRSAYLWAFYIGNRDVMKLKVVEYDWINQWNHSFPNDKIVY